MAWATSSRDCLRFISSSVEDTERLGRVIGRALRGGEVIGLYGDLGTGKTTLVRGIAAGLRAAPRLVSSPTFVLIHEYRGRLLLAHADLYRLASPDDVAQTGLSDYLDGTTVTVVEWADHAGAELPNDRLEIRITHRGRETRVLHLSATGPISGALLRKLCLAAGRSRPRSRSRTG
ncbi:MAG TPA: tRNA (adenosine(37)-N6)-threonylcarbamoyltransferase complex ATPase subunit type 1 TsaE [Nitrospiraceae bacterium]|jgi:tRNA threonylcarbamoyladenosine biosynthesis protein TsaE|nr:tRNA (adenosine(37)-N6)-threonylcarbamoyltransferase complex ATPase subunit type 1 TsaE [Nitrospiraceae bacterium]